jgi:protein O-mannosyl-transferase
VKSTAEVRAKGGKFFPAVLILALAIAAYFPVFRAGFIWNDSDYVTAAPLRAVAGLRRIWFELGATQQYYPVLHSVFWLEHRWWADAALGYHLANVLLHGCNAVLLVAVLRRLGVGGAWLAGVLFALHPVGAESVAWITEQKNTLSLAFYLLAALAYLRFEAGRDRKWYWVGLGFFLLALLSKSVTATLPGALLVAVWWRRGRLNARRDIWPMVPWFVAGAAVGLLTAWVERRYIGAEGAGFDLGWARRLMLAERAIWFYLGKLIWPANLVFVYPRWAPDPASAGGWLGLGAVAGVTWAFWRMRHRSRGPLAAWLFFIGSLFPTLGFFNVYGFTYSYVADHWQYIASLGVIVLVAAALTRTIDQAKPPWQSAAAGAAILITLSLGVLTWRQCLKYRDDETLYRTTLAQNPGCWMAHNNLGNLLRERGALKEAEAHYRAVIPLAPDFPPAYRNLAATLLQTGRPAEARDRLAEALRLDSRDAEAHDDMGMVLFQLGDVPGGLAQFQEALALKPNSAAIRNNYGNVLLQLGRRDEAELQFSEALRLRPDYPEASYNLALALSRAQRFASAIERFQDALRLRPEYVEAHSDLALAFEKVGRIPEAAEQFARVVQLRPNSAQAHNNLGNALFQLGRRGEAQQQYEEAIRLDPALEDARENLRRTSGHR